MADTRIFSFGFKGWRFIAPVALACLFLNAVAAWGFEKVQPYTAHSFSTYYI